MILLEPDVALTDFGLAIECGCFALWLPRPRKPREPLYLGFLAFFVSLTVAALLGGVTHGFLPGEDRPSRLVWIATLIAIGAAAPASWMIGAHLVFSEQIARLVTTLGGVLFAIYLVAVLFVTRSYEVAILHYLLAAVFLLVAFTIAWRRRRESFLLAGLGGVALTFVAAGLQQTGTDLHPVYFNHNALYHLVQAVALALMFWAARGLLNSRP